MSGASLQVGTGTDAVPLVMDTFCLRPYLGEATASAVLEAEAVAVASRWMGTKDANGWTLTRGPETAETGSVHSFPFGTSGIGDEGVLAPFTLPTGRAAMPPHEDALGGRTRGDQVCREGAEGDAQEEPPQGRAGRKGDAGSTRGDQVCLDGVHE